MSDAMVGEPGELRAASGPFLDYLERWMAELPERTLADVIEEAGAPQHVAIFCIDLTNGFCYDGPLQSPRVAAIVPAIVKLFNAAYAAGIRSFILPQDAHDPHAVEFDDYPPHCIQGTAESHTVPELADLPFESIFRILHKNSINASIGTRLADWLNSHPEVTHRIVVGDCTDICTYQLALHLKCRSNAANERHPVLVPADCVDTYDLPVDAALAAGAHPHPAALMHPLFLHSMAQNGIQVLRTLVS
jgi:nicotinamidase-related amidase